MSTAITEQGHFGLVRVSAETVDRWLTEGGLESDVDLYDLVEGGRGRDGSFQAHPDLIAVLEEVTGIKAEHELVPFLTDDEIILVSCAKGMARRFEQSKSIPDEDRAQMIRSTGEVLINMLLEGVPS
jgi:hypothetical protein